jgi:ribonuclease HII
MIIAGVDEAGRGSVLGPLVVAGVAVEESKIPELRKIGVKDSKLLSPKKRKLLYRQIREIASMVVYERVQPKDIDHVVINGKKLFRLNYLEAQTMASVLHRIKFDVAYIDCCDTNQVRFGQLVSDLIADRDGRTFTIGETNPLFEAVKSEHHADRRYPVVSAASIVAKVARDSYVKRLHKKYGMFGSGYPSDPDTIAYLKKSYESSKQFPSIARMSWLTVRRLISPNEQDEDLIRLLHWKRSKEALSAEALGQALS